MNQTSVRSKPNLCEDQSRGSLRPGGMPERGLELCFTEDGTVASPRTIARPHCRAELCGSAEQSQVSVQEELGLTEHWSRTSQRSGAWPQ